MELKKIQILAFFLQLYLISQNCSSATPLQVHKTYKLVSGLQMERVAKASSFFYKEFVPLVYQFTIPRWNKSETIIHGSQNCNATTYSKFFTTCPILYYLTDIHERFSEYLVNSQPLVVNLEEIGAKPEVTLIPFDCELVQPHFDDIYIDKVTLSEYLGRLKSCSALGSQEFIQGISNYVYNISSIYFEMRRNFYSEYWLKIDLIDGRVDAAIWSNAINTLNSLMYQNYMMEANRWKLAVVDCEAGRIPSTVLPPALLSDTLNDMLETLASQNLIPAVSTETIGNYYKSSLTDCTFTSDSFVVRILVPVIPEKEQFLLVKVAEVPFYYEDGGLQYQCQIDKEAMPQSGGNADAYVIVDLRRNIAYESDCVPGKLCHIPTALHPRRISACATAAFNWERFKSNNSSLRKELLKHCPIKCAQVNYFQQNKISQIAPGEFLLFSSDKGKSSNLTVNCSVTASLTPSTTGVEFSLHNHKPPNYGAQLFDIYCNCRLSYQSQSYKPKPCNGLNSISKKGEIVQITYLAPLQWYEIGGQAKFKDLWNIPEDLYFNPNKELVKGSLQSGSEKMMKIEEKNDATFSPAFASVLVIFGVGLTVWIGLLGWKLYSLIEQLERLGFNVRENGYNVNRFSGGGSDQQVSYRNMGSLLENDSLSVNDSGH